MSAQDHAPPSNTAPNAAASVLSSQRSPQATFHPVPQSPSSGSQGLQLHQHQQHQHKSVKRPRPVKSCTECRKRKLRCDRLCPCSQCQKSSRACKYTENDSGNMSEGSDGEAEASRPAKRPQTVGPATVGSAQTGDTPGRMDEAKASAGHAFVEDLAVRMERLERHVMSGRTAGVPGFGSSGLVAAPSDSIRGLSIKHDGTRTRYFGQTSPRVLLTLFGDAREYLRSANRVDGLDDTLQQFRRLHECLREQYQNALAPIRVFTDSMMPIWKRMTDILPKKDVCDRLIMGYMDHSEAICRIIHFPTFSEQYNLFWEGSLQSEYFMPQLLAMISIASRFTTKTHGFGHERVEGVHLPTAFALVRSWLDGLKGKQRIELGILQVEMLLIVCQKTLMFKADEIWTQLGSVVRLAMTMGLHRDPSEVELRLSPFQREMRRRLWFSLMDLDVQISMQSNLPCLVREGDFTTKAPRNLDDLDLSYNMRELPPSKPLEQSTQCQLLVLAASSLTTRSRICHLLTRIDTVRDFQEVLELGTKMEGFLEDMEQMLPRKGLMDHSRTSRLWRERVTFDSHMRCALLALYRPFAVGGYACPPQISKAFMRSCMTALQWADELDPMLPHYQSTMGVLHQLFKNDIILAAFSVCYFIGALKRPQANGVTAHAQSAVRLASQSPGPGNSPPQSSDALLLWSPERLTAVVERTLDRFTHSIHRNIDTKDIVSLCVVLEMVKTPEPKHHEISRALNVCLDKCLETAGLTREKLGMTNTEQGSKAQLSTTDAHMGGQHMFNYGEPARPPPYQHHQKREGSRGLWSGWD